MANKSYNKGVRLERKLKKELEADGCTVLRTAGSHGFADLVSAHLWEPVVFIQVKVASTSARAKSLLKEWIPALAESTWGTMGAYTQCLYVWDEEAGKWRIRESK